MNKIGNYFNPTIDMFSIRTNSNGEFVFDVTVTESENKLSEKISAILALPYKSNIDNLVNWYSQTLGQGKEFVKQILDEIHELGREGFLEKHKDEVQFEMSASLNEMNNTTMWDFKVYKEDD